MLAMTTVTTPLSVSYWQDVLSSHPDQALARYIIGGLGNDFRIGFRHGTPLKSAQNNLQSASAHPEAVREFVTKELSLGRLAGPVPDSARVPALQINRIGVVPKGHNTGKWRLITDLSFPNGFSVNDGIDPLLCSLTYTTVDDVAAKISLLGQGALMAKIDVESAYRLLPVHPQDRIFQAIRWEGDTFIDLVLPFGLRSAAKIFNTVADALNWHLRRAVVEHIDHYLDDFIMLGSPGSSQCDDALAVVERECCRSRCPTSIPQTGRSHDVYHFPGNPY